MKILLKRLSTMAIIGIYPHERTTPQEVIFSVELEYDFHTEAYIDYEELQNIIVETLHQKEFLLLEDAIVGIQQVLTNAYPNLKKMIISLCKSSISDSGEVWVSESFHT